jgi:predicted dienelactone hydrolase
MVPFKRAVALLGLSHFWVMLCMTKALAGGVGFAMVRVADPPDDPLQVGIWYPSDSAADDQDIGLFTQTVAQDGAVAGTGHPLVVMSHGNGGTLESHYDTALALAGAGYVVAAMTHTGDNWRDRSFETELDRRPRAVHVVIDYMLTGWTGHAAIDPAKIGMFGFSAGAFTTLVSAGGIPDLSRIGPYCAEHPDTYVCQLVKADQDQIAAKPPITSWIAEPRIKAAVVAAPAIGFTFSKDGLKGVQIPIQLWRAGDDHILPSPDYVEPVRDGLPRPAEYKIVTGADHFDFLAPCSDALARTAPDICQERNGFDRAAFHENFNRDVVAFFDRTFHTSSP